MGIDYRKCETCDGTGSVWVEENMQTESCRDCGGHKYVPDWGFIVGGTEPPPQPKSKLMVDTHKVVRLYDGKPVEASPPVDEVLVAKLEELLYAAKAGEFFSFAIVTEMASKAAANTFHVRRGGSRIVLLGALSRLEHSIHEEIDGDDGR